GIAFESKEVQFEGRARVVDSQPPGGEATGLPDRGDVSLYGQYSSGNIDATERLYIKEPQVKDIPVHFLVVDSTWPISSLMELIPNVAPSRLHLLGSHLPVSHQSGPHQCMISHPVHHRLEEKDDPDLDPIEAIELHAARLESLVYAQICPHIDSETSTSSTLRLGVLVVIPSHIPHDPK
ncbi:hypothetical protein HAX54_003616, partial [Datura stramonium]|nr:hypothetical protein [Datura stramonium]